jgi:hypothetical protein
MAEARDVTAILTVFQVDPESGSEMEVGSVGVSTDGRLAVLQVSPEAAENLSRAVAAMNAKPSVVELVPDADATGPGDLGAKVTERDDPAFIVAASRYMARYYGFSLG